MLVLDEIHKFSRWRQVVKGLFDKWGKEDVDMITKDGIRIRSAHLFLKDLI